MITKFKIFENEWNDGEPFEYSLFDIDDYVMLNPDYFLSYERDDSECRGIISDISYHKGDGWEYDIWIVDGSLEQGVSEHGIERKMTEEEIKQLEIEKEASRYNL